MNESIQEVATLTFSAMTSYLNCPRLYQDRYQRELVPIGEDIANLRIGTNWHTLQESHFDKTGHPVLVLEEAYTDRDIIPGMCQEFIRLLGMYNAYERRFPRHKDAFEVVAIEKELSGEIENPDSTGKSRSFTFRGKADLIGSDAEGVFLTEHKTTSRLDPAYIKKVISFDLQSALYAIYAGQILDSNINRVLYNVAQKCTLKLKKTESPIEFQVRVEEWYLEHPEAFWREEIAISDQDKAQAKKLLWSCTKKILMDTNANYFPQNPGSCEKWGRFCPYYDLCASKDSPLIMESLYQKKAAHSELSPVEESDSF